MSTLTAEPRPNGTVAIAGLLAHPAVLAALLESRDLVVAAADGDLDALSDLADALRFTWVALPADDLASIVAAVESRTLVVA